MRAYVAITPLELQGFVDSGSFKASRAWIASQSHFDVLETDTEEELEFESSLKAAVQSRAIQGPGALGFALAVDLTGEQVGTAAENQVEVLSDLSWSQVQSLLLAESDEPELSWFAAQEILTYLPQWLA